MNVHKIDKCKLFIQIIKNNTLISNNQRFYLDA